MAEFQVLRNHFSKHRLITSPATEDMPSPGEGEIVVRIERFSFTANNITYAAAGDQLGYWQFFPPSEDPDDEWGIIPVWGFAEVVASNVEEACELFGVEGRIPHASMSLACIL